MYHPQNTVVKTCGMKIITPLDQTLEQELQCTQLGKRCRQSQSTHAAKPLSGTQNSMTMTTTIHTDTHIHKEVRLISIKRKQLQ